VCDGVCDGVADPPPAAAALNSCLSPLATERILVIIIRAMPLRSNTALAPSVTVSSVTKTPVVPAQRVDTVTNPAASAPAQLPETRVTDSTLAVAFAPVNVLSTAGGPSVVPASNGIILMAYI
jgi:hypothetical protein